MKKAGIIAAAVSCVAAGLVAQSASAAPSAISFNNTDLFNALKNYSTVTLADGTTSVNFYDETTTPSSNDQLVHNVIMNDIPITKIEMNCVGGDPLADITDFSDLDSLTTLETFIYCNEIDYDFPSSVTVMQKHAPLGQLSISEAAEAAFTNAEYEFIGANNDTTPPVAHHANSAVLVGPNTESVKTIKFDCSEGDPLAAISAKELTNTFEMFPFIEKIYVCAEGYEDKLPKGAEIINQNAAKDIPAGDYFVSEEDWKKAEDKDKLPLSDAKGEKTEYTVGDILALIDKADDDTIEIVRFKGNDDGVYVEIKKGKDTITLTAGKVNLDEDKNAEEETKAETEAEAEAEAEEVENPATLDNFSAILLVALASSALLGFGIATKARR